MTLYQAYELEKGAPDWGAPFIFVLFVENMPTKLQDIITLIDKVAPFSLAEEWDNSGLQVGDLKQEIRKILIALDPTRETLQFASEIDTDLLLTHHPLIFKPLSNVTPDTYPGDILFMAIQNGISIVAAHTNLDAAKMGINDMLADLLGLINVEPLEERDTVSDERIGFGRIGNLENPVELSTLVEEAKNLFGNYNLKVSGRKNQVIKRVAVMGGAGGGYVSSSKKMGADVLITGDVRHHEALEAKAENMALIDAGHFYTEKAALKRFTDFFRVKIEEMGWESVVTFHTDEKDPIE